ncbi:MAG TPA: isoprenylcysteine carboxylmethyltransferase family protein [Ktedonobacteraceae bacterium]|nr:isoprenylcysteine carboxylmethyltransferase family protein [Ktedonobacteraceae bacterium]
MNTLLVQAVKTSVIGILALGALLFLPAWTLAYWQAWVFIVVFTISTSAIGIYLSLKDPVLLERRMKVGPMAEENIAQKIIISLAMLSCLALLVFCALDYRFAWSPVPPFVSLAGDVLVALGLLIDLVVFRENSYGASTIQVVEDQKVISTGLYAHVRHPMYVGVLVMMIGVPLALGSWWGLLILALVTPVLVWRILNEEHFLQNNLPGYKEYTQKIHYRLVPYVW